MIARSSLFLCRAVVNIELRMTKTTQLRGFRAAFAFGIMDRNKSQSKLKWHKSRSLMLKFASIFAVCIHLI
jgi:hypothetical protein